MEKKIKLKIIGTDGNAFAILGKAREAARRGKMPKETLDKFMSEATSGDYNHLLATCMEYFEVC